jgi:hypothetical protein
MLTATGTSGDFDTQGEIMNMKRVIVGALLSGGVMLGGLGLGMGTANAFNPQPDPPGDSVSSPRLDPGAIRGFNPQPEPPGKIRGFDPQPDPPGVIRGLS